jgi:hypothetical protein
MDHGLCAENHPWEALNTKWSADQLILFVLLSWRGEGEFLLGGLIKYPHIKDKSYNQVRLDVMVSSFIE